MKGRESGMPDEDWWSTFFDAEAAIQLFVGPDDVAGNTVEFGSGYGTFTLPIARRTHGTVTALDIEPEMVARVQQHAQAQKVLNIRSVLRDFVTHGTGLDTGSQAHAMIYNLLHIENPVELLKEARRVLRIGGTLSVMHWRSDIATPRGPSLTTGCGFCLAGRCRIGTWNESDLFGAQKRVSDRGRHQQAGRFRTFLAYESAARYVVPVMREQGCRCGQLRQKWRRLIIV